MSTKTMPISVTELSNTLARMHTKPTLSTPELAELLGIKSVKTIYLWCAAGRFKGCFRKRGKHLVFFTPRTLDVLFNGPDWNA